MAMLKVLNCFFDPFGCPHRRRAFEQSSRNLLEQGADLLSIELAVGDAPFVLRGAQDFLRLRCSTLLWHKERLINLALAQLPEDVTMVAWVDGDILFDDDDWIAKAKASLEEHDVLQLFEVLRHTNENGVHEGPDAITMTAMTAEFARTGKEGLAQAFIDRRGHTCPGGAIAARREVLSCGVYDRMVLGGGDDIFMRCLLGVLDFLRPVYPAMLRDIRRWETKLYANKDTYRVACLGGSATHIWHGSLQSRGYAMRQRLLEAERFDPRTDLQLEPSGLYCLQPHQEKMRGKLEAYFMQRAESALPPPEAPRSDA